MKKMLRILRKEKGMTVAELLVAVGLLSITLGGIFALLQFGNLNWNMATQRMQAREEAARASSKLGADLREAKEITEGKGLLELADKNGVLFYANIDSDIAPEKIRYYLNEDRLVRAITQPSGDASPWSYQDQPQTWVVAKFIRNNQGDPIFAYLDSKGSEITALPASEADIKTIAQVRISLIADTEVDSTPSPVAIQTSVFLRNRQ